MGLLVVPLRTAYVGLVLLLFGGGDAPPLVGAAETPSGAPRPFTPGVSRAIGAAFLALTLGPPAIWLARTATLHPLGPWVFAQAIPAWLLSFGGHLVAVKLFERAEPKLPRR
jgi:hypothetical protein